MILPDFIECNRTHMEVINPQEENAIRIYASSDFSWRLLRHHKPHELGKYAKKGLFYFDDLLKNCLPGYHKLCGRRFPSQVLLRGAGYIAGLAFFMAVWRFSQALGPSGK